MWFFLVLVLPRAVLQDAHQVATEVPWGRHPLPRCRCVSPVKRWDPTSPPEHTGAAPSGAGGHGKVWPWEAHKGKVC